MPRVTAWRLLRSGAPTPLREVERAAAELAPRDRALVRRLIGTEVRRRGTLRALVREFAHKKASPDLAAHLHLGFVQAFFLDRIPDHALVSETLRAVHLTMGPSKVNVANAILRNALRSRLNGSCGEPRRDLVGRDLRLDRALFHDPVEHPLLWAEDALSIPATLFKRWSARLGEERARELALGALEEPWLSLRVRPWTDGERSPNEHDAVQPNVSARDAAVAELVALGADARPCAQAEFLRVPPGQAQIALASAAFQSGRLTVQGAAAFAAARALGSRPGERLLDLCAAPGGKSAVLAESGAHVVAVDKSPERMQRARETWSRLGLAARVQAVVADAAAETTHEGSPQADALPSEFTGARFDGVLIDAPCTNTGVLARRPEAKWRFGPAARATAVELGARLLGAGAARVRPGGRLVWSTCSLEPEENEAQVRRFLAEHPQWSLEEEHLSLPLAHAPHVPLAPGRAHDDGSEPLDDGSGPLGDGSKRADDGPEPAGTDDGGYWARLRFHPAP